MSSSHVNSVYEGCIKLNLSIYFNTSPEELESLKLAQNISSSVSKDLEQSSIDDASSKSKRNISDQSIFFINFVIIVKISEQVSDAFNRRDILGLAL